MISFLKPCIFFGGEVARARVDLRYTAYFDRGPHVF